MCDLCEEYKAQSSNSMVSDELEVKYNDHIEGKNATKVERSFVTSFNIADKALAISLPPRSAISSDQIALYAFLVVDKWAVKLNTS
jgi:hypothetical protein